MANFNRLNNSAFGVTWQSFELQIYNQATTRKRLLTQGSTSYETIDFETSQNLLIGTDINRTHTPSVLWPAEYEPPGHKYSGSDLQDGTNFLKYEVLATGTSKKFFFTPESLPHGYVWELIEIENTGIHADKMFPARQNTTGLQTNDIPLVTQTKDKMTSMHISSYPNSLPLIFLDSPHILSESGNTKFIYRTRWDFRVRYTRHMTPSARSETSQSRFVLPYPSAKLNTR
jgi:hypothetical protein